MDDYLIVHLLVVVVLHSLSQQGGAQAICHVPEAANEGHLEIHEDYSGIASVNEREYVRVKCSQFYIPEGGNEYRTCKADGSWSDVHLRCRAMECSKMYEPSNGYVRVNTYAVGGIATFYCYPGYEIKGHKQAICLSNMEFDPSDPPECSVLTCPAVYYLRNGYVENINQGRKSFSYQTVNRYVCDPGYRIQGPQERLCGANGEWEGTEPYCKEIVCEKFGPLYNGRIQYTNTKLKEGTFAFFTCKENSDRIPDIEDALCLGDGEWSDSLPQCLKKADLKPLKSWKVYIGSNRYHLRQETSVSHGTRIRVTCEGQRELYHTEEARYYDRTEFYSQNVNGSWTPALPNCVFERCDIAGKKYKKYNFTFYNGTTAPVKVDHDTQLLVSCKTKYEFEDELEDNPSSCICKKGTIKKKPLCVPASCSVELQKNIYLDAGMNEIVEDLRRIRSGTKVFFHCTDEDDYELFLDDYTDVVSDTCSFGGWIHNRVPVCKEKRCQLDMYEGARFVDMRHNAELRRSTKVESGSNVKIQCDDGFIMVDGDSQPVELTTIDTYSTCTKGKWSASLKCVPAPCLLTYESAHMEYKGRNRSITSGSEVTDGDRVFAHCENDYQLQLEETSIPSFTAVCTRGKWSVRDFPVCVEKPCMLAIHSGSDYWIDNDGETQSLYEDSRISSGTRVNIGCHPGHSFSLRRGNPVVGETKYSVCFKGVWSPIYVCEPDLCDIPGYPIANGYVKKIATNDRLDQAGVKHGTTIKVKCDVDYELSLNGETVDEFIAECSQGNFNKQTFPTCVQNLCDIPGYPVVNGYVKIYRTNIKLHKARVKHGKTVKVKCDAEYELSLNGETVDEFIARCSQGNFSKQPFPTCVQRQTSTTLRITNRVEDTTNADTESLHIDAHTVNMTDNRTQLTTTASTANRHPVNHVVTTFPTTSKTKQATLGTSMVGLTDSVEAAETTTLKASKNSLEESAYNSSSLPDGESHLQDLKGCVVPDNPNMDVYIESGNYSRGAIVPHGNSIDVSCYNDYDSTENQTSVCVDGEWVEMLVCENDMDVQSNCDIENGYITQDMLDTSLYYISCKDGYQLNYNAKSYKCRNGGLFPATGVVSNDTPSDIKAECLPGSCKLPNPLPSGMKIRNVNGTYISGGNTVSHNTPVNISCQKGFEPQGRTFRCSSSEWLTDTTQWRRSKTYTAKTLDCRPAMCETDCNGGLCLTDDTCTCDNENYGLYCEKAYCLPLEGIEIFPKKVLYIDSDELWGAQCVNQSLAYNGPERLMCLPNGTWNENPKCVSKSRTYYIHIHFIASNAHLRSRLGRLIKLQGSRGIWTAEAVMEYHTNYEERPYRRYIFKFLAEDIDHVERITMTSPFSGHDVWVQKINLERRDTAKVYEATVNGYLSSKSSRQYELTRKTAFYDQFDSPPRNVTVDFINRNWKWMQRVIYKHISKKNLCETKCLQESKFTCATIAFVPFVKSCITLPYTTEEYSYYFKDDLTGRVLIYSRQNSHNK